MGLAHLWVLAPRTLFFLAWGTYPPNPLRAPVVSGLSGDRRFIGWESAAAGGERCSWWVRRVGLTHLSVGAPKAPCLLGGGRIPHTPCARQSVRVLGGDRRGMVLGGRCRGRGEVSW